MDFDDLDDCIDAMAPAMTFYAISDVHVELKGNMEWLKNLPEDPKGTVLVAGDLGISCKDVERALRLFKRKYAHVFYCFGNHELWASTSELKELKLADSFGKIERLREICRSLDIKAARPPQPSWTASGLCPSLAGTTSPGTRSRR